MIPILKPPPDKGSGRGAGNAFHKGQADLGGDRVNAALVLGAFLGVLLGFFLVDLFRSILGLCNQVSQMLWNCLSGHGKAECLENFNKPVQAICNDGL